MKALKGKGLAADHAGGKCVAGIFVPKRGGMPRDRGDRWTGPGRVTHMGLGAEEVEAIMVDSEDTGGWHQDIAATLDEEEGGAKQGKGTEEACSVESLRSGHQNNRTATALSCQATYKSRSLLQPAPTSLPPLLVSSCTSPSVPSSLALCQASFLTQVTLFG